MSALVTVAIPTYGRRGLLLLALESLQSQTVAEIDVVVFDNAGDSGLRELLRRRFPAVAVLSSSRNLFYAGAANRALRGARSPFVAVLNDDAFLERGWAEAAIEVFARDRGIGSVASKVLSAERPDRIDSAGDELDRAGRATGRGWGDRDGPKYDLARDVFSAAGSCAIYRREAFEEAGGFDDSFVAYFEDVDLGFRLQLLGHRCVYEPSARAFHVRGGTPKRRRYALWLTERNMVWNVLKNMPATLLRRHALALLSSQGRPAPMVGGDSWLAWGAGKASAFRVPRAVVDKRRRVQETRRVSDDYVEQLLSNPLDQCHL